MEPSRRSMLQTAVAGVGVAAFNSSQAAAATKYTVERTNDFVLIKDTHRRTLARYLFGKIPAGETAAGVPFTDYTHPIWTPAGEVITDVGAKDHPHHRGVFCAWIQAEGALNGDWWGWGQRAPKAGRTIVNRSVPMRLKAAIPYVWCATVQVEIRRSTMMVTKELPGWVATISSLA